MTVVPGLGCDRPAPPYSNSLGKCCSQHQASGRRWRPGSPLPRKSGSSVSGGLWGLALNSKGVGRNWDLLLVNACGSVVLISLSRFIANCLVLHLSLHQSGGRGALTLVPTQYGVGELDLALCLADPRALLSLSWVLEHWCCRTPVVTVRSGQE